MLLLEAQHSSSWPLQLWRVNAFLNTTGSLAAKERSLERRRLNGNCLGSIPRILLGDKQQLAWTA